MQKFETQPDSPAFSAMFKRCEMTGALEAFPLHGRASV